MSDIENGQKELSINEKAKKALEAQVTKVLKELTILGDLGIKHKGEISPEVVEKIFEAVKKKITMSKKQFKNNDDSDEFKL